MKKQGLVVCSVLAAMVVAALGFFVRSDRSVDYTTGFSEIRQRLESRGTQVSWLTQSRRIGVSTSEAKSPAAARSRGPLGAANQARLEGIVQSTLVNHQKQLQEMRLEMDWLSLPALEREAHAEGKVEGLRALLETIRARKYWTIGWDETAPKLVPNEHGLMWAYGPYEEDGEKVRVLIPVLDDEHHEWKLVKENEMRLCGMQKEDFARAFNEQPLEQRVAAAEAYERASEELQQLLKDTTLSRSEKEKKRSALRDRLLPSNLVVDPVSRLMKNTFTK